MAVDDEHLQTVYEALHVSRYKHDEKANFEVTSDEVNAVSK
jgi:hypothetical protein